MQTATADRRQSLLEGEAAKPYLHGEPARGFAPVLEELAAMAGSLAPSRARESVAGVEVALGAEHGADRVLVVAISRDTAPLNERQKAC